MTSKNSAAAKGQCRPEGPDSLTLFTLHQTPHPHHVHHKEIPRYSLLYLRSHPSPWHSRLRHPPLASLEQRLALFLLDLIRTILHQNLQRSPFSQPPHPQWMAKRNVLLRTTSSSLSPLLPLWKRFVSHPSPLLPQANYP